MKKIIFGALALFGMCNKKSITKKDDKRGFIRKVIDDDTNVSAGNFFLVVMTIVGVIMLIVPVAGLIVDMFFNHTITINLSDLGSYILAVSGIFGVAGLSNAWIEYSWNKYGRNIFNEEQNNSNFDCSTEKIINE